MATLIASAVPACTEPALAVPSVATARDVAARQSLVAGGGFAGTVPIRVEAMPGFVGSSFPAGFYRGPGADGGAVSVRRSAITSSSGPKATALMDASG